LSKSTFDKSSYFLFWLINPFLSTWIFLRNSGNAKSLAPLLLFSFFFGISFVNAPGSSSDSHRYALELENLHTNHVPFSEYMVILYSEEGSKIDVYQPVLTWLLAYFTGNYKWLFGVFALVFGFFWFKSITIVRDKLPEKLGSFLFILFVLFVLINPIWSINGVRMWTAVQVFFYGLLLLHTKQNKWGIFFIVAPSFIHFSLFIALVIYLLYVLIPFKRTSFFYTLYLLTYFLGELDIEALREYFELLPGFTQSRKLYLNEEILESNRVVLEQASIHISLYHDLLKYLVLTITTLIFYRVLSKLKTFDAKFVNWFNQALFFGAFSNLAVSVPSGARFEILTNLLLFSSFIWILAQRKQEALPTFIKVPILLVSVFIVIVQIRMGLDFIGLFFFIGNPIINMFYTDTVPFIDLIKALL